MGSGLGGGGFWLLHRASDGKEIMIDGRERAPLAATANMYLDKNGEPIPRASLDGPLAAGIPGVPAALVYMARHYGRLPLTQSLAPAIEIARDGFPVYERFRKLAGFRQKVLQGSDSARVFLDHGKAPEVGYVIKQPDLAKTLQRIATHGRDGFYRGTVARRMVKAVRKAGGIWTQKDLDEYRVVERKPVTIRYHDSKIISAALPSSGGIVLAETFNILEGLPLNKISPLERKRLIIEAMRRGYNDRARFLGDSDYVSVNQALLTSKAYAAQRRKSIGKRATPSSSLPAPGSEAHPRGTDTTHFSIIDAEGNRVSATLSINYPFGCGFMPPGTGVVLNNEMDDFVIKPGVGNVYGLVGAHANQIAPGKRPLSSMSPSFVEKGDQVLVIGTPGGSRIISMVLLGSLEFLEGRGTPADWVALPRYHHQYIPDVVQYEDGAFDAIDRDTLEELGYHFKNVGRRYGNMQVVLLNRRTGKLQAASDPRGEGLGAVREVRTLH
jgi:gamma-glutamyltranspeptidase/glutathione hydrolase